MPELQNLLCSTDAAPDMLGSGLSCRPALAPTVGGRGTIIDFAIPSVLAHVAWGGKTPQNNQLQPCPETAEPAIIKSRVLTLKEGQSENGRLDDRPSSARESRRSYELRHHPRSQ